MARLDDLTGLVVPLLGDFLARQRWYGGDEPPAAVEITATEVWRENPLLVWMLLAATPSAGPRELYQLVIGGRPAAEEADFLTAKERVTLGTVDGLVLYDALVDPELALDVLHVAAPGEQVEVARPLVVEASNSSVVYDERLILKLFRRVHDEPNPDVEITHVLEERGFPHVVRRLAELRRHGRDLAVVRQYLLGSTDAWQLAHTSLRDLLGSRVPPDEAGGDFGPDAATLGTVTAELHLAMADAFGHEAGDPKAWLAVFRAQLDRLPVDVVDKAKVAAAETRLLDRVDAGRQFRVHGDLHLGQFLRADAGWFVLDFEGEPARPVAERVRPASPLRDVAGMVRSFHYAAHTGLAERGREIDPELVELCDAWEYRAVAAYWRGYTSVPGIDALLPATIEARNAVRQAYELDKAVYELCYELAHRPDWVSIPGAAIERALATVG